MPIFSPRARHARLSPLSAPRKRHSPESPPLEVSGASSSQTPKQLRNDCHAESPLATSLQLIRGLRRTFRLEAGLRNLAPDIFKMVVCQTVAGELLSGPLGETPNNRPDVFGCASFEACRETFKNKPERVCITWLNVLTSHRYSPLPFPLTNATCKLTISYQNEIAGPKGAFLSRLAAASWTRHTSRGRPGLARPPAS